jgi:hypothetical protein
MSEKLDDENMLVINRNDIEEVVLELISGIKVKKIGKRIGFAV